jgi:hypothetical protein
MRAMAMEFDDEDDKARWSKTLLVRPQRSHEESTNKYKYKLLEQRQMKSKIVRRIENGVLV